MDYLDFIIGGSFFLLEIVLVIVCYELIYRKRNVTNWTFGDFGKALIGYYFFVIKYTISSSKKNRDMDDFLEKNVDLRYALWEHTIFGGILLLFLPVIVAALIKHIQMPLINVIVYAAGLSVLLDHLKESRIKLTNILNESHKFLFRYKRIRKQMKEGEKEEEAEDKELTKNTGKYRRAILVTVLLTLFTYLLLITAGKNVILKFVTESYDLKQSTRSSLFPGILALFFLIAYLLYNGAVKKLRQKVIYRKHLRNKADIDVWTADENELGLENWVDETLRMCELLNIKEVGIELNDTGAKKVYSFVTNTHMPIIMIGSEVFIKSSKSYAENHFEIIRMMIAHELVHIHYRDALFMKKVYMAALIYIGFAACAPIIVAANVNIILGSVFVLLLMGLDITVFKILRDERYWKQVMEFRADRVGMSISGTSAEVLEKVLACSMEEGEENIGDVKNNIIQQIYQKEIMQQIHPGVGRRIYEAKRGKPWGSGEYFRYLWMISRNLLTGKGWSL